MSHIPDAARIIKEQNLGRLHESAWLENVMEFLKDDGELTLPSLKAWGFFIHRPNLLIQDLSSMSRGRIS